MSADPTVIVDSGSLPDYRQCEACDQSLPLTGEFYHRDASDPAGFRHVCIQCRKTATLGRQIDKGTKTLESLQREIVKHATSQGGILDFSTTSRASLEKLVDETRRLLGGEVGIATIWANTFFEASSKTKASMLGQLFRDTRIVQEMGGGERPAIEVTQEELIEQARALIAKADAKAQEGSEPVHEELSHAAES